MAYLDYLKIKKQQRECEGNLHIFGSNFEVRSTKHSSPPRPQGSRLESKPDLQVRSSHHYMISSDRMELRMEKSASKDRPSRPYHTVEVDGHHSMSRQEMDLLNQKPFMQRRKIASNQYLVKGERTE